MNRREFSEIYPTLSGALAGEFQYPAGRSDEELARSLRDDLPRVNRRKLIQRLLGDCYKLLPDIEGQWQALSDAANRSLDTPEQARCWLNRIMVVWERTLLEIDDANPL